MTHIIQKNEIISLLESVDLVAAMEEGFIKYSNGKTVVPPVAELLFDDPDGDVHIKYGYIKNDEYYCIKIASGFHENTKLGLSSSQGMMLLFSQRTGEPIAVLLDDGELTNIRTAAAGALVAKYFAPDNIERIGILGAGTQGKLQLEMLSGIIPCSEAIIWDRNTENASKMKDQLSGLFNIEIASKASEVATQCSYIVTCTPSNTPLLNAKDIIEGTHITAVGSDTHLKQELAGDVLEKADILIADSLSQCKKRGEIFKALESKNISEGKLIELGTAIENSKYRRSNNKQISVVDLTGVAVQDIMIATAVFKNYLNK